MKKIAILGGGESGVGAAVLAKAKGFDVLLSDSGKLSDEYRKTLQRYGIDYEEGSHSEDKIMEAALVVKSPGIPESAPLVRLLRLADIPVISEIEFAGRYTGDSKTICITGSNGKTTTTTLIHKLLSDAGYDVGLGGNIGKSFAYMVATQPHEWYVLEISSFQLDGMTDFKTDIAVLLNITPDHLDRYEYDILKYAASKMRVINNQTHDDYFIYSADDHITGQMIPHYDLPMRILPFSATNMEQRNVDGHRHGAWHGAHTDGDMFIAQVDERRFAMSTDDLPIKGKHNLYNAMAATMAAMAAGVTEESIRTSLSSFHGVEHRLERIGFIDGVEYINDSKATNTDAVWYALESMDRPVVWIAGGTDKGNDYSVLHEFASAKVKTLVALGIDNTKITESFTGIVPQIHDTASMVDALEKAISSAVPGDVVLLSPACASFDLFKNYEDRGRQFRDYVTTQPGFSSEPVKK